MSELKRQVPVEDFNPSAGALPPEDSRRSVVNIVLWVVQGVLAALFLASGGIKLAQSRKQLAGRGMDYVEDFSGGVVKTIGAVEVLAAVGLVLPGLTGIATILVPLAASGLVLVMIGAAITHIRRGEYQGVAINIALLVLAAVAAWGRFGPYAF
jgi:hypothetical protein